MQRLSPRFRSQQCFYARFSDNFFTQLYRDFDGDAMLAPIRMAAGNQQKHLSLSLLQKREFISSGTQKHLKNNTFFNT